MKMLGNSLRGLNPIQKRYLYRCCILPITLYSFQLWYYNKVPLAYLLKELRKMQRRAAIWITGAFCTSPTLGIETISCLIPIHLHLQKLNRRFHLWAYSLFPNHIINLILDSRNSSNQESHQLSLNKLMPKQHSIIKGPLIDISNRCNEIFPSFSPFNYEFSLGNRLIDVFVKIKEDRLELFYFSFHFFNFIFNLFFYFLFLE